MLAHVASQVVAHEIGVPVGSTQQVLEAVGCGIARDLGQLPAVLALYSGEQTAQIVPRPASNLAAREVRGDPLTHRVQLLRPRAHRLSIHRLWQHILLCKGSMMPGHAAIYNCSTSTTSLLAREPLEKPFFEWFLEDKSRS